jgi:hypothetical protein
MRVIFPGTTVAASLDYVGARALVEGSNLIGSSREEMYRFLCGVRQMRGVGLDVAFHSPENFLLWLVGESPESSLLSVSASHACAPVPGFFLLCTLKSDPPDSLSGWFNSVEPIIMSK